VKPVYFKTAAEFRAWLEKHHASRSELWIGFYKKGSGISGITYKEAVDEALCFGWIDGLLKSVDATRYIQRFTPRRPTSIWSRVNVRHVDRLTAAGKMHAAGLAAFAARNPAKTGVYSFEAKQPAKLPVSYERRFKANRKAWTFFTAQAPWYQRTAIHLIAARKQEATRERWLDRVIEASAAGKRLAALDRAAKPTRAHWADESRG
jgi:uncharacterized protein YdeI (YjbR/CyaY-like superfamily)